MNLAGTWTFTIKETLGAEKPSARKKPNVPAKDLLVLFVPASISNAPTFRAATHPPAEARASTGSPRQRSAVPQSHGLVADGLVKPDRVRSMGRVERLEARVNQIMDAIKYVASSPDCATDADVVAHLSKGNLEKAYQEQFGVLRHRFRSRHDSPSLPVLRKAREQGLTTLNGQPIQPYRRGMQYNTAQVPLFRSPPIVGRPLQ